MSFDQRLLKINNEKKIRALLSDLGGPYTRRGVKKCPNCGTYTGSKGLNCKNQKCGLSFRTAGDKTKQIVEVSKLNTGSSTQVFSVRVKERGSESRGFVQLPMTVATTPEGTSFVPEVSALCFVDSCFKPFQHNILKCHENTESLTSCSHIQSALQCKLEAQTIPVAENILSSFDISEHIKQDVLSLLTESPGPLVQRISRTTFAVKCKITTQHPLGFVHVSFHANRTSAPFVCSCFPKFQMLKTVDMFDRKCCHYYSCVAAFCSDLKLTMEFTFLQEVSWYLMHCALSIPSHEDGSLVLDMLQENGPEIQIDEQNQVLDASAAYSDDILEKTILISEDISQELDRAISSELEKSANSTSDGSFSIIHSLAQPATSTATLVQPPVSKVRKRRQPSIKKPIPKKNNGKLNFQFSDEVIDPVNVSQSFIHWLSSVTERINQTMHFQLSGKPDPLVFHIPQAFFDCLAARLVLDGGRKQRLPNSVTRFVRRFSPPLGVFYNYTWLINNILHAKAIFDTPLISLNVTRSFVENSDGTYDEFDKSMLDVEYTKLKGQVDIRPVELKTYLKIGKNSADQIQPSSLLIDWTPDVLPLSQIGELKITFEYGHVPPQNEPRRKL